jgi:hypothetical protein
LTFTLFTVAEGLSLNLEYPDAAEEVFSQTITQSFNNPQVHLKIKCLMQSQALDRVILFFRAPHWLGGNCCDF